MAGLFFYNVQKPRTITMTSEELDEDRYDQPIRSDKYDTHVVFEYRSLRPGDTLKLRDVIEWINYKEARGHTNLSFSEGPVYSFQGDLTDEFNRGDLVVITFHIIEGRREYDYGDRLVLVEGELIDEEMPYSRDIIEHVD
jgi:hypothetical protein